MNENDKFLFKALLDEYGYEVFVQTLIDECKERIKIYSTPSGATVKSWQELYQSRVITLDAAKNSQPKTLVQLTNELLGKMRLTCGIEWVVTPEDKEIMYRYGLTVNGLHSTPDCAEAAGIVRCHHKGGAISDRMLICSKHIEYGKYKGFFIPRENDSYWTLEKLY